MSTKTILGTGAILAALAVVGYLAGDGTNGPESGSATEDPAASRRAVAATARSQIGFTRWQDPTGMISAEVPTGWRVDGQIGTAVDLGQFKIEAYAPDGRSFLTLAHNWLSFMEARYGPYRPGHATVEALILPQFVQSRPEFRGGHVVYRSANDRVVVSDPTTGMGIPFDGGTLGFLLARSDGGFSSGTAYGETLYISSPGTPGLWRLRLFAAAYAPAEPGPQATIRAGLERLVTSLELSGQFFSLWRQAHDHTVSRMRDYSAKMDRVFSEYLRSAGRSSSDGNDPYRGWAEMMRGGQYAEDETTGEQYWVGNDHDYWWVNDQGTVVGNDTGDVPTYDANWRRLRR